MKKMFFLWPIVLFYIVSLIFLHNLASVTEPSLREMGFSALLGMINYAILSSLLFRIFDFSSPDPIVNSLRPLQSLLTIFVGSLMYGLTTFFIGTGRNEDLTVIVISILSFCGVNYLIMERITVQRGRVTMVADMMTKMLGDDFVPKAQEMFNRKNWIPAVIVAVEFVFVLPFAGNFQLTFPLLFGFCFCWVAIEWRKIMRLAAAVLPSIWLVLVFCIIEICCFCSPQGQDTLCGMTGSPRDIGVFLVCLVIYTIFATVSFYAPLQKSRFEPDKKDISPILKAYTILPVAIIVYTNLALVALVLWANDPFFGEKTLWPVWRMIVGIFFVLMVGGIVWIHPPYTESEKNKVSFMVYRIFRFLPDLFFPGESEAKRDGNGKQKKPAGYRCLWGMAGFWVLFICAFTFDNGGFSCWCRAHNILFIALCAWIGIAGVIQTIGVTNYEKPDRPLEALKALVIPALILSCLVFSPWRNNHQIRMLKSEGYRGERQTMEEIYNAYCGRFAGSTEFKQPVIVAAEGGGLRSAYWTGMLLGHLCDTFPARFSANVIFWFKIDYGWQPKPHLL